MMNIHEQFGIPLEVWNRLVEELEYYKAHQTELVAQYDGKYLVLSQQLVVAAFDSNAEAYFYAIENLEPGTFILQKCSRGDKDYKVALPARFLA